jgi:hypothetical protein
MAVSAKLYGNVLTKAFNKEINLSSDTIKVALCTSTYTPDQDAHIYYSSVTNEVTGTGYTAGGATLASKTVTYNGTSNTLTFDAADTVWSGSTITARYAVIYDSTGTASTSPLIAFVDFGADVVSSGGPFTITWDANGLCTFTVA